MFDGFVDERIDVGAVDLRVRHAGAGTPVLLVHGHPRTGATWHEVARLLVQAGCRVVVPDMRGYGRSGKARVLPDHSQQSKRAVAGDLVTLMRRLGHDTFAVAGHDRGSYVALRTALDHPQSVTRLVVMDGVPISEALDRCDARFAQQWYHWFFYAQPTKPERAIGADPLGWYGGTAEHMGAAAFAEFLDAIHDPATVQAMLEDYRAGLGVDREHERADREAGRRVSCPTLLLWSSRDDLASLYGDPLEVWRAWAGDLVGAVVDSGHHMAEENPRAVAAALLGFLERGGRTAELASPDRQTGPR